MGLGGVVARPLRRTAGGVIDWGLVPGLGALIMRRGRWKHEDRRIVHDVKFIA